MTKEIFIAILGSGALSTIISFVLQALKDRKRSNKIDKFLLLHLIEETCRDAVAAGHIAREDLQKLDEMYTLYKGIGGNGYADAIVNKVKALPVDL